MEKTKKYVLGFAFTRLGKCVVLIEKQKPDWQKGKYNGVGGKIEDFDETPLHAMVREFEEETSVVTELSDWDHFATMDFKNDIMGGGAEVYCFRMFSGKSVNVRTAETEKIEIFRVAEGEGAYPPLPKDLVIKNLHFLIPMALDTDVKFTEIQLK